MSSAEARQRSAPLEWRAALDVAFDAAHPLASETVPVAEAASRRLTTDVTAPTDLPHYASSAMDGWAITGPPPWRLADSGSLRDGPLPDGPLRDGTATPILTGGAVPPAATGVLRSEHGTTVEGMLLLDGPAPRAGDHVRPPGEEARAGDILIASGTLLNPVHLAVAAACGLDLLDVGCVPRVALVLTGDEVITSGTPAAGQVRDSFGPMLPTVIEQFGGFVVSHLRAGDGPDELLSAIRASDADLVVTTGGTGDSSADRLRPTLGSLAADILVDGIAVRPARLSVLARLPSGQLLVGLPGNPLAAMMGLLLLGRPVLAALGGGARPSTGTVVAGHAVAGPAGRTALLPYRLVDGAAEPTAWRGAGMLRGLAEAHGVLIRPAEGARTGDSLETIPLPWSPEH